MERLHPNNRQFAWPRFAVQLGLALSICVAGCTNQQMSASNPFMAPDRVPPPATRTIAPGTAAPYYPGDPVPAAQIAPPAPPVAQAQPQMTAPTVAIAMATPAAAPPAATAPKPLEFTNERSVAIPADNQDLRFALPSPLPATPTPLNPAMPQPIQPQSVQQFAAAAAPASAVVPAAFNQPLTIQSPVPTPTSTVDTGSSGPWRSPQLPQSASPVMQAQYLQPQPGQPTMLVAQPPQPQTPVAQQVPVELHPVASNQAAPAAPLAPTTTAISPATAPAVVPPPRMRFPSMLEPSTWFTPQPAPTNQPPAGQQLIGYMVPGADGQMHMISVEQYQATLGGGGTQQAASVASSDGFRPRGTSTK